MPSKYAPRLLTHLQHASYEPETIAKVAQDLRIEGDELSELHDEIDQMQERGEIVVGPKGHLTLPPIPNEVTGSFKKHPKGFGFIKLDMVTANGDLFVPANATGDAISGDRVRAEVVQSRRPRPGQSPFTGEIVEILERKYSSFSGEAFKHDGQWWVDPDGKVMTSSLILKDADSKNVREGDKVMFEVLVQPTEFTPGEAVVTKVLGASGQPNVETAAVIEAHGLPGEFPEIVVEQAREQTQLFDEELKSRLKGKGYPKEERWDIREEKLVCTIDPPDAKDYDDAISIEYNEGIWTLGVHIADVANFVRPGTELDDEALLRGNSCYLPRLVIPMLPEILSNGICSLQEGVPRYAKSAFIDYDDKGKVRGIRFAATLIQSAKRMTYLEAQALIDGDLKEARKQAKNDTPHTEEVIEACKMMNTLARKILKRREAQGMINLDLPEVELVYDDEGKVIDAVPEDDAFTHRIIEMFMVEANEAVARLFEELEVPIIRRTHPEPVPGQTEGLASFATVAGYRIPKSPTREDLQGLLNATKGSPAAPAVHMAVLRTLTRAEYSPNLVGHFALASEGYAHFTSPIRRYPDLTVHRALTHYLQLTDNDTNGPRGEKEVKRMGRDLRETKGMPDEARLTEIANICNGTAENAENAERELRQFLVLQFLEREHLGDSMPGIVTGVSPKGVFVRIDRYLAEGMCAVADLPAPGKEARPSGNKPKTPVRVDWRLDQRTGALVEQNSGRSFQMGDRVEVTIAVVDLPRRTMELVITKDASRAVGKGAKLADPDHIPYDADNLGKRTGAQKRAQRSKSRDKRKSDFRDDRKGGGKRQ